MKKVAVKNKRTSIPQKIRAELQQEIGSACPFCESRDVGQFQVHHIDGNNSNGDKSNLLLLCPTCHSKATKGDIKKEDVYEKKMSLISQTIKEEFKKPAPTEKTAKTTKINGSNNIVGNNNVVNNQFNIKRTTKKVKGYPEGTIGNNGNKHNYITHLIGRYHECLEKTHGKENVNYAIYPTNLKRKFKIGSSGTIYNLKEDAFPVLVDQIQRDIDNTEFSRRLGRGHKNYSSFEEYEKNLNDMIDSKMSKIIPFRKEG